MRDRNDLMVVVNNGLETPRDDDLFFGALEPGEEVLHVTDTSLPRLLVAHGFFPTVRSAIGAGHPREIPPGFTERTIGKFRRTVSTLCVAAVPGGGV